MRRNLLVLLALLFVLPVGTVAAAGAPLTGWLTFSNSTARTNFVSEQTVGDPSKLNLVWTLQLDGFVTAQPLVVRDFPNPGDRTTYVATAAGSIYAINQNGYAIAKAKLGHMKLSSCAYFPTPDYGVTGTPVIDPATRTLYAADALGYVHALDLATLAERPGWPVRLFKQPSRQLVWGALTLARGKLYVPTALLCAASSTNLFSVDVKTRKVAHWSPVPLALGGGGGMWGWGGVAFDARTRSILALTGDALAVGRNVGKKFSESSGYAEHLVRLDLNLHLRAANAPVHYRTYIDADLTGTPVVMRAAGCPALVAGQGKSGTVFVWRLDRINRGPVWKRKLAPKLNGQPAWSPLTRSLYVVGHTRTYRLQVTPSCGIKLVWSIPLPTSSVNGPPIITGNVIWFTVSGDQTLWAVDATTGDVLWRGGLAEAAFAPPAIVDGRVVEAAFDGLVSAFQ